MDAHARPVGRSGGGAGEARRGTGVCPEGWGDPLPKTVAQLGPGRGLKRPRIAFVRGSPHPSQRDRPRASRPEQAPPSEPWARASRVPAFPSLGSSPRDHGSRLSRSSRGTRPRPLSGSSQGTRASIAWFLMDARGPKGTTGSGSRPGLPGRGSFWTVWVQKEPRDWGDGGFAGAGALSSLAGLGPLGAMRGTGTMVPWELLERGGPWSFESFQRRRLARGSLGGAYRGTGAWDPAPLGRVG